MAQKKNRITPQDLNINPSSGREADLFKWWVAVQLFAKPVQQEVAAHAFEELKKANLLSTEKLSRARWQRVVNVFGRGHYVRYDESTASRLIENTRKLRDEYGGKVRNILKGSKERREFSKKLQEFKGIGPKGAEIFLREVKV